MKAPYFTVLIDAYNYGHYIEEAVSSALAQGFPREEREILLQHARNRFLHVAAIVVRINQYGKVRRFHKRFPGAETARLSARRKFSAFNPNLCRKGRVNPKTKNQAGSIPS